MPKQNLGRPKRATLIRHSQGNRIFKTEINTEKLSKEIEKRVDDKLTKLLLEAKAEIERIQQKYESEDEDTAEKEIEQASHERLEKEIVQKTIVE